MRDHLNPGGMFVLYNTFRETWLVEKLASQLTTVFGQAPLVRTYRSAQVAFAAGPGAAATHGHPPGDKTDPMPVVGSPEPRQATDDWPFLYLREPFIAPYYLAALGFLLLLSTLGTWLAGRRAGPVVGGFSPHFFALGAAFLLLETKSLVTFSLLFGTTWLVNALVFFAILGSVLVAIGVTSWLRPRRSWPLYVCLAVSLAIAYLLPAEQLLIDPAWLRYVLAAAVAFAPVFFANLVFTYSFRDVRAADMAFASNLLGAMIGGVLEYLALLTGYRFLILVVAGLYALAYLLGARWRILADRTLESGVPHPAALPAGASD